MWQLKNSNFDKHQKPKSWQDSKTQIVTKLNYNCDDSKLKLRQNSKTQIVIIQNSKGELLFSSVEQVTLIHVHWLRLSNSKYKSGTKINFNSNKTKKLEMWQLKKSYYNKIKKKSNFENPNGKNLKSPIATKLKLWYKSTIQIVTTLLN